MNYEQIFKNIDDILWKEAGCSNELDYVEQTSWILFLKYLDDLEDERSDEMELQGKEYKRIIKKDLVKVTQSVKQDAVLVFPLGLDVMLHHW